MGADGRLSPRNARRFIREHHLEADEVSVVIATYWPNAVALCRGGMHIHVDRVAGQVDRVHHDDDVVRWASCSDMHGST